ncbi:hypothetical protein OG21DRAFT_376550 [Imleria badia]|nr:hypothetical protein OG21DRAFT_376550 [Imleria badia]
MGKTYSCNVVGCNEVFRRACDLRKHKVWHVDPSRLFYCEWPECTFYTLTKRNLEDHFYRHTEGEKANDPSVLTKYYAYEPEPPEPSKHTRTYQFIDCNPMSTLSASKPNRGRKQKNVSQRSESTHGAGKVEGREAVDGSSPSTSQQGADAIDPSSSGSTMTISVMPNENMAPNSHGSTYVQQLDAPGSVAPTSLDTHGWSPDVESPHGTDGSSNNTPVAPYQEEDLFQLNPATAVDWSIFDAQSAQPTPYPALSPEMTEDLFKLYFDSPGCESWDNFWEQFLSNTSTA